VALQHSRYQAGAGKIDHSGPRGEGVDTRLKDARISWRACGENLAYSLGHSEPAQIMVDGWMDSPGHRANILNGNFTHGGLGIAKDKEGAYYGTQVFARF
jgi:uncharacterized protein YkwD